MTPFILRSRIFNVLGSGFVVGAALAACGGDVGTSGETGTAGAGGTAGTAGAAGAGGTAGTMFVDGGGGSGGMGGSSEPRRVCFTPDQVRMKCAPNTGFLCMTGSTPWDADAGFSCPSVIGAPCLFYSDLVVQGDNCCYLDPSGIPCGRPFLVDGEARRAAAVERIDWLDEVTDGDDSLDARTRRALALAWLDDARLEHASIASFARYTLDLLALGAPADLVADAQRAAADEVRHAQRCFSLASRYHGDALGPGPLAMDGSLPSATLVDAAVSAVREGCIGETMASLSAASQLERASDAMVRRTLSGIAEDEARHAELAWRFVAWAIERGGAVVRSAVAEAFREALQAIEWAPSRSAIDVDGRAWRAHGRLSATEERACQLRAAREVIEPCARALLGRATSGAPLFAAAGLTGGDGDVSRL
jgi:hypothetical protein